MSTKIWCEDEVLAVESHGEISTYDLRPRGGARVVLLPRGPSSGRGLRVLWTWSEESATREPLLGTVGSAPIPSEWAVKVRSLRPDAGHSEVVCLELAVGADAMIIQVRPTLPAPADDVDHGVDDEISDIEVADA